MLIIESADFSVFTIIEKSITALSALAIATVAIWGLKSWKKETKWKRENELLFDLLEQLYRIKESISQIRSSFGYLGEGMNEKVDPKGGMTGQNLKNIASTVNKRLEKYKDDFAQLFSLKIKACIYYPEFDMEVFAEINQIKTDLIIAARKIYRIGEGSKDPNIEKYEKIIFEEDDDQIVTKIKEIIEKVENEFRKTEK